MVPRVRLVADDGHLGQRDQQAGDRTAVRVRCGMDRRPRRAATGDDGRHPDGRRRAGRSGAVSAVWSFYVFYFFNALGYVCGGPLPCQVLVSRWFEKTRGKAMGIAYLGIGIGGAIVPLLAAWLIGALGWRASLQTIGVLIVARAAVGVFRSGRSRIPASAAPAAARRTQRATGAGRGCLSDPCVLPPRDRQHVLDRGRRRNEPASEIVPQPGSALLAECGGLDHFHRAGLSIGGRLFMGWLSDRCRGSA